MTGMNKTFLVNIKFLSPDRQNAVKLKYLHRTIQFFSFSGETSLSIHIRKTRWPVIHLYIRISNNYERFKIKWSELKSVSWMFHTPAMFLASRTGSFHLLRVVLFKSAKAAWHACKVGLGSCRVAKTEYSFGLRVRFIAWHSRRLFLGVCRWGQCIFWYLSFGLYSAFDIKTATSHISTW